MSAPSNNNRAPRNNNRSKRPAPQQSPALSQDALLQLLLQRSSALPQDVLLQLLQPQQSQDQQPVEQQNSDTSEKSKLNPMEKFALDVVSSIAHKFPTLPNRNYISVGKRIYSISKSKKADESKWFIHSLDSRIKSNGKQCDPTVDVIFGDTYDHHNLSDIMTLHVPKAPPAQQDSQAPPATGA